MLLPTASERTSWLHSLNLPGAENQARRRAVKAALADLEQERSAIGAEMNQMYASGSERGGDGGRGPGVYTADETEGPPVLMEGGQRDLVYIESTYPGKRLPHAWIGVAHPFANDGDAEDGRGKGKGRKENVMGMMQSTHDVCGHGGWSLLTGIGGTDVWKAAVERVQRAYAGEENRAYASEEQRPHAEGENKKGGLNGFKLTCTTIGWGQECNDILDMWEAKRGVEEDGAVLVRPDRVVAWRCRSLSLFGGDGGGGVEDEAARKLQEVLGCCLGFGGEGAGGGEGMGVNGDGNGDGNGSRNGMAVNGNGHENGNRSATSGHAI